MNEPVETNEWMVLQYPLYAWLAEWLDGWLTASLVSIKTDHFILLLMPSNDSHTPHAFVRYTHALCFSVCYFCMFEVRWQTHALNKWLLNVHIRFNFLFFVYNCKSVCSFWTVGLFERNILKVVLNNIKSFWLKKKTQSSNTFYSSVP